MTHIIDDTDQVLMLSQGEVDTIRRALRAQEEAHRRNGFHTLEHKVANLRSKISDQLIATRIDN